nr:uncharacterized protein LOC123772658 isoform X2 [Procambarus clarkii]
MTSRHNSTDSEEIRQSLDVLDRVLSEFDDVETDTNDESSAVDVTLNTPDLAPPSAPPSAPPPIDRTLKPREPAPAPPELPRKTRLPRPGSGSSSPSSHEYQEINSDVCGPQHPDEEAAAAPPATILISPAAKSGGGVRRQMSEDRARLRRHEDDSRRQPRRQRSEDTRLRRDDLSSSSGDLTSVDLREMISKPRPPRDTSRGRSRDAIRGPRDAARDVREPRHLRKSRSGDVEARRHSQDQGRRRRSRSSDRWLDHSTYQEHLLDQRLVDPSMYDPRMVDPRMVDPRMVDPRMVDPRMIGPRMVDPRMVDPRLIDPRYMDEPFPHDPIRFPHLMSYPSVGQIGPMAAGRLSPVSQGIPVGPPFLPMEYPPYPLYPYDVGYIPDPRIGPDQPFLPPHQVYPGDIPVPEYIHPDFLPPDYPLDYPLDYGPGAPHPALMAGMWGGPGHQPGDDWPPPTPEQAQKLINSVVRNPSRSSSSGGDTERGAQDTSLVHLQPPARCSNRRLTSIGHSDSSGLSSPTEERRPLNRMQSSYRTNNLPFREPPSEFRVGEAVRDASPRGPPKTSISMPHFSSGKDSGFDETPLVEDVNNSSGHGGRPGGSFIVSGVFNDSSRMFIPAPPSPTPDYDDDGDSDGNESDILQGSQFYVVTDSQGDPIKKKVANRDSLSDDSLQNAPVAGGKSSKASTPVKKPSTPLQNMIKEFHQGLPPFEHENGFSDDSLEDSTVSPSRPSTASQKPCRQTSEESLASMESSTASFDYMNAGQARNSSYGRPKPKPSPTTPGSENNNNNNINNNNSNNNNDDDDDNNSNNNNDNTNGQKGSSFRDRKDVNGKVKKSVPKAVENGFTHKESLNKEDENSRGDLNDFSRQCSRESSHSSGSNSSKPNERFDTIRHMLKEGLIEGLDESPPQFKPPPPTKKTTNGVHSDERADSGLGSVFSTTRTDESGGSDNRTELSGTPSLLTSPKEAENFRKRKSDIRKGKETVRSRASIASEDVERNRDDGDEVEIQMKETLEVPPPPPPRDESMHWTPRIAPSATQKDHTKLSARSMPTTPSTSKNPSWLHNAVSEKDEMIEVASNHSHQLSGDKVTHIDDLYGQNEQHESGSEVSSAINGSLASHYSIQDNDNPLTDREFLENLKNLEPRPRPDTLAVITEDQGSIGSRGSRSGRLLSRITDSVRSGSRTPTPSSSSSTTRATTTKLTSTSRSSTRIHGDIIREPWRSSLRESALPSPQDYARLPSLSPSVIPLTRDGSGRFRSIEDLAEAISTPEDTTLSGKKKKHSTLPPNLTPGDMKKENKELRRATSLMVGKKGKAGSAQPRSKLSAIREKPPAPQISKQASTVLFI